MHRTDAANHDNNLFTDRDPVGGTAGTVVEKDWLNAVQEEVVKIIEEAGIALVKGTNTQLMAALQKYFDPFDLKTLLPLPLGHISGLEMSNNGADADHDIDIAPGACRGAGDGFNMELAALLTKQIDASWAPGGDAGAMAATVLKTGTFTTAGMAVTGVGTAFDTEYAVGDVLYSDDKAEGRMITAIASATAMTIESAFTTDVGAADEARKNGLAPSCWYHAHLIRKDADGATDAMFDTSIAAAGIPAGYTAYRRLGSVLTDASSNLTGFAQSGGRFIWIDPPRDIAKTNPGTDALTAAMSVPLGLRVEISVNVNISESGGATQVIMYANSPETDNEAVSWSSPPQAQIAKMSGESNIVAGFKLPTDSSSQIRYRLSASGANVQINITTLGWEEER